ncbi:hypothetical protein [Acidaminococcus timonensis]|uniref:hypothetical protein n=1 Tax=Acidaminococcus timonensis TaxID=1871002 RepID=UPI0008D98871|nr:hypothetical protein [Acidaminococcus timonensis]
MKIDKNYVMEMKAIARAEKYKDFYKYCTLSAGVSDIAALIYRTSNPKEIGEIPFGEDGDYKAHLIAGDTDVPSHYNLVLDTASSWLWIYDDDGKVLDLENPSGFQLYRAGERGLIIRFK